MITDICVHYTSMGLFLFVCLYVLPVYLVSGPKSFFPTKLMVRTIKDVGNRWSSVFMILYRKTEYVEIAAAG